MQKMPMRWRATVVTIVNKDNGTVCARRRSNPSLSARGACVRRMERVGSRASDGNPSTATAQHG
jgi:hypothetical protein